MSDKQARFSHVRIIENTPARVVVHWRNSPVDKYYRQPFPDPETGWGDWSDEYYTVYPDGVAVRRIVMWSTEISKEGANRWDKPGTYEWAQTLPLMHAGQSPEDIYEWDRIMSVANLEGDYQVVPGPDRRIELVEDACIQVNYLKSQYNPFLILRPEGSYITQYYQEQSGFSRYPWWNHWPVAQVPSGGRYATAPDRPSHSCTSTQECADYESTDNSVTKVMLCGFTNKDARDLIPLAKSWARAPELEQRAESITSDGYDLTERAYHFTCNTPEGPVILEFALIGSKDSPVVNPAFIIKNWGKYEPSLTLNGKEMPGGKDFRFGYMETLTGTDLVTWIKTESEDTVEFILKRKL
jgi:hypothetical protein